MSYYKLKASPRTSNSSFLLEIRLVLYITLYYEIHPWEDYTVNKPEPGILKVWVEHITL